MAAQQPSIYKEIDRHMIRLRKMSDVVSKRGLYEVLLWLTPSWKLPMSFEDYLDTKQNGAKKKKRFKGDRQTDQEKVMMKDPTCISYDVSLLYLLIFWGNEFLADDDAKWKVGSDCLESLIKSVKYERNIITHCYENIDVKEFYLRTEMLRNLVKDMVTEAGSVCSINQDKVDQILQELDTLINQIRDDPLDPKDFEAYKKELLFQEHCDLVKDKGKKALHKRHEKFSSLTPVSRLAKAIFPVHEVFTDMILKGESGQEKLKLENLLECNQQSAVSEIVLVEGDAGVGKTTLTKMLLSDWTNGTGKIKHLDSYDLVLHFECRDQEKTYMELLTSSMPEVSQSFQGEDLKLVTLGIQCLIIIDGFDEINENSTQLFKEILSIKKHHDITVVITTRPEATEKYFQFANAHQIGTKHIRLIGIPKDKREDFVKKYYTGLENKGMSKQGIDNLLKYLKRTANRLSQLWRLPYNLTLLTILWTNYPDEVNSITTAPELHWQIHQMYISKLKERLENKKYTQHLPLSEIERKIHSFIYKLCWESLIGLQNNQIYLTEESYQRLKTTCQEIDIPVEEMVGAFLKRTNTSSGTRYSFPHKGLQDFLAGHYFWMRLTEPTPSYNIQKITNIFQECLSQNDVPISVSQNIIQFAKGELEKKRFQNATQTLQEFDVEKTKNDVELTLKVNNVPERLRQGIYRILEGTGKSFPKNSRKPNKKAQCKRTRNEKCQSTRNLTPNVHTKIPQNATASTLAPPQIQETTIIRDTLQELCGSKVLDVSKFQNMIISMIGMFYLDCSKIENDTKLEALMLLKESGVKERDAWLDVLSSVKCDEYVASFISKQSKILMDDIIITDSSVLAYISLMQALKPPMKGAQKVRISIDIRGDMSDTANFLELIGIHQFRVQRILVTDENFVQYNSMLKDFKTHLKDPHEVSLDMEIEGDIQGIEEFITHIKFHQLKVRKIVITDNNYIKYTLVLKSLSVPLRDAHEVVFDIHIKDETSDISELVDHINENTFNITTLQVNKIRITDSNFNIYNSMLQSLSSPFCDACKVNFEIYIKDEKTDISELVDHIIKKEFKITTLQVNKIRITDSNFDIYNSMLQSLSPPFSNECEVNFEICIAEEDLDISELVDRIIKNMFNITALQMNKLKITDSNFDIFNSVLQSLLPPWKDIHNGNIDLHINKPMSVISDFLNKVQKNKFKIRKLKLQGNEILIKDDNLAQCTSVMKSLLEDAYKGDIKINIHKETSGILELMETINKNNSEVSEINLLHDFKNPASNLALEDVINQVSARCELEVYAGRMTLGLELQETLKVLHASVADANSYKALQNFFELMKPTELNSLWVCVKHDIDKGCLRPIPDVAHCLPSIYIPDIGSEREVQNAIEIVNRLYGKKWFEYIHFPRSSLSLQLMTVLIRGMNGVKVHSSVVFPSSYKPPEQQERDKLQKLAKGNLKCNVRWGILDIDEW